MEIEEPQQVVPSAESEEALKKKQALKKKKAEPKQFKMSNPSRATPSQISLISVPHDQRFAPVVPGITSGIVLLRDTRPGEPAQFVDLKAPLDKGEALEPEAPEPFEWSP